MPGSRSSTDPEQKSQSPRESGEDSEDESEILEESPCGRWLKRREEVSVNLLSYLTPIDTHCSREEGSRHWHFKCISWNSIRVYVVLSILILHHLQITAHIYQNYFGEELI